MHSCIRDMDELTNLLYIELWKITSWIDRISGNSEGTKKFFENEKSNGKRISNILAVIEIN